MRSKEVEEAIKSLNINKTMVLKGGDSCITSVDNIETVLSYIEDLEEQVENYMKLSANSLVRGLNESIRATEKNKTELELLNEGWKQVIRDKIKELEDYIEEFKPQGYIEDELNAKISVLKELLGE